MIAILFSLCGEQLIPITQWTPHKQAHVKSDEIPVEIAIPSPPYTPTIFHLSTTTSAYQLYKHFWEHFRLTYPALKWNGMVIYPGEQTLSAMGFSSSEMVSFSYQEVCYFYSHPPFHFFFFLNFFMRYLSNLYHRSSHHGLRISLSSSQIASSGLIKLTTCFRDQSEILLFGMFVI